MAVIKRFGAVFSLMIAGFLGVWGGPARAELHNWAVELIVEATPAGSPLSDIDNFAAVVEGASDGFDSDLDACVDAPPPVSGSGEDYLSLSFYHPEFENVQEGVQSRCSADFQAPFEATGEWDLLLETNLLETELVLTWQWDSQGTAFMIPGEYRVFIVDGTSGARITLQEPGQPELEDSEYRIVSGTAPMQRALRLSVINDPPPRPQGLEALAGPDSVLLRWDASSQPDDVDAFVIRYGTESGVYPFERTVGDVDEAVVGGLAGETTYYFRLWARDRTGLESRASEEEVSAQPDFLGDLAENGFVDYEDLFALSLQWYALNPEVDFTWDGSLDPEDLLLFQGNWHRGP